MAVPFSKPCYSGSGSAGRRRPARARPSSQHPQQQQLQQSQQQQQNQPNPQSQLERHHEHPVTRFLYGDGQIHLESLSLTSRVAFYALYEAWRLLQDLTQNTGTENRRRRPRTSSTRDTTTRIPTPVRNTSNVFESSRPDIIPRGDVSTQSTWTCRVEPSPSSSNCSSPCQSPMKSQVKRQRLMSDCSEDDFPMMDTFTVSTQQQQQEHHAHHNLSSQNYPDMIPDDFKVETNNNNYSWLPLQSSSSSPLHYPDLISSPAHHQRDRFDDTTDEEEEEVDKGVDDVDGYDGSMVLSNVGGVDWYKLGAQLSSIANTFESTFYKPANDEQKAVYEAFQRIKMSSSLFIEGENSLSGFAKMVCRQVLLSSIWILLKKVLWRKLDLCSLSCDLKYQKCWWTCLNHLTNRPVAEPKNIRKMPISSRIWFL